MRIANKKVPTWDSVDVIDDYTIRINMKRWSNTVYNDLADSTRTWMISSEAYKKNGEDWMRSHPVGTGPFKFDSFQRDAYYMVVKNDKYRIKGEPYLDAIRFTFIRDPATKKAAMQSGEVDVMELDPDKLVVDLKKMGFIYDSSIFATVVFVLDTGKEGSPFTDQNVREAAEYAINREAIAAAFRSGLWDAPYQVLSVKENDYIMAEKAMGSDNLRIMLRNLFPTCFNTRLTRRRCSRCGGPG